MTAPVTIISSSFALAAPDAAIAAEDVGVAPVALLDGVVAAVVWPPSRAAIARRALSSDRVLMRAERGTDGHEY